VGIVLPVHNEEQRLPAALRSIDRAMEGIDDWATQCRLVVVLDDCNDGSSSVVDGWPAEDTKWGKKWGKAHVLSLRARNVGLARQTGCAALLDLWSATPAEHIWLATTDADSEVPRDWLTAQVRARTEGAEVWVGPVEVGSWDDRATGTADEWNRRYAREHRPVHGANFGIDAAMYLRAGGFEGLVTGEDRDLLDRALVQGAVVRVDASVRVITSARRQSRAPRGFAHALSAIEESLSAAAVAS